LPLPRWGVLGGKSSCTGRRWRLCFVQREIVSLYLQSGRSIHLLFGRGLFLGGSLFAGPTFRLCHERLYL
jgi:hypothetical protein